MPKKEKLDIPVVRAVTIEPARNGFMLRIETKGFNTTKYVCKDFEELINSLKTLNWGQKRKITSLNDSLKPEEE